MIYQNKMSLEQIQYWDSCNGIQSDVLSFRDAEEAWTEIVETNLANANQSELPRLGDNIPVEGDVVLPDYNSYSAYWDHVLASR